MATTQSKNSKASTNSKESTKMGARLRSVEAKFLDCLSNSETYYKKQVQAHRRPKSQEVQQTNLPPAEPSFNVSSVRRMRKIEDDYPDSEHEDEEELPVRPMSHSYHSSVNSTGMGPRMRSASRNSYSSLPHGARRLSRASWSTHDLQEQLEQEREVRAVSRPSSAYVVAGATGSENTFKIPEAMQKLKFDDVESSSSMSTASKTQGPAPVTRPRYSNSSPASSEGSVKQHHRVYSDFHDRSHSVSPVSGEAKKA